MNEMKSLTLNGKTYDSFPDKKAVKTINGEAPDENGNVKVEIPEDDGGGLTDTARILLMTVLKNGVYTSDQSANLAALEEALKTSGGGGSDEPDVPDVPDVPDEPGEEESVIVQNGDTLYIVSGVTANQSGSVLVIA